MHLTVDISFCSVISRNYTTGITKHNRVARNIAVHVRPRGNKDIISHRNSADQGRVDAYPDAIPYNRGSIAFPAVLLADGHALMQVAIRADDSSRVHRDVVSVAKVKARSDIG